MRLLQGPRCGATGAGLQDEVLDHDAPPSSPEGADQHVIFRRFETPLEPQRLSGKVKNFVSF